MLTCSTGHFALWKQNLHHRDIRPQNLLYRRLRNNGIMGFLQDHKYHNYTPASDNQKF